ncbi:MAG: hypothetical protein HYZ44_02805 [Bacteroidetes bacterium]|nr:hypothetical protein [Bacteroidota bacterium]
MGEKLYHFLPRKFENEEKTISIVNSIFEHGFYLSKEILKVNWKDMFAIGKIQRTLEAEQFRFCLTAISNKKELAEHSIKFGLIGLEFNLDFILQIGGFPVFYVPTPLNIDASAEEYKGVSLLYRLADAQQIFEHIIKYNVIQSKDIDIKNVLGAIKFLANICYPTQRKRSSELGENNYYNQREWRVIYNLTAEGVKIGSHNNIPTIEQFNDIPIRNFITKIIVFNNQDISEQSRLSLHDNILNLINHFGLDCKTEYIDSNSC